MSHKSTAVGSATRRDQFIGTPAELQILFLSLDELPRHFFKLDKKLSARTENLSIPKIKVSSSPPVFGLNTLVPGFATAGGEAPHRSRSSPPLHLPPRPADSAATFLQFLPLYLHHFLSTGVVETDRGTRVEEDAGVLKTNPVSRKLCAPPVVCLSGWFGVYSTASCVHNTPLSLTQVKHSRLGNTAEA